MRTQLYESSKIVIPVEESDRSFHAVYELLSRFYLFEVQKTQKEHEIMSSANLIISSLASFQTHLREIPGIFL